MKGNRLIAILFMTACGEVDRAEPVEVPGDPTTEPETATASETTATEPGPTGLDLGCTDTELSWELELVWTSPWFAWSAAVTRTEDGDGDGDVDLADPVSFVTETGDEDGNAIYVHGYESGVRRRAVQGAWRASARPADVDDEPGAEVVASWYVWREDGEWITIDRNGYDDVYAVPEGSTTLPWVADLDGDGQLDLLLGGLGVDLATGETVREIHAGQDSPSQVAVDLDLDGQVEILTATPNGMGGSNVGILGDSGMVDAPCTRTRGGWSTIFFAVGELDGDPEGEFVAASINEIAVCDSDGSLLRLLPVELEQPSMVAIGDLDGDLDAEIVVTGAHWPDHPRYPILVLDHALRPLWSEDRDSWAPLSLADLDGDGDHELLILVEDHLEIRDGDGTELARWELPEDLQTVSWHAQPVVADVDLDGLAEITLPLSLMVVLDTPTGGFPAPGAAAGWSGLNHFPGYVAADGTIDATGAHWLTPGQNAWNAHPVCVDPSTD